MLAFLKLNQKFPVIANICLKASIHPYANERKSAVLTLHPFNSVIPTDTVRRLQLVDFGNALSDFNLNSLFLLSCAQ